MMTEAEMDHEEGKGGEFAETVAMLGMAGEITPYAMTYALAILVTAHCKAMNMPIETFAQGCREMEKDLRQSMN